MSQNKIKTAILLFARKGKEEAKFKHLSQCNGSKGSAAIVDSLLEFTLGEAKHSGFSVYHFDSTLQRGNCFGSKLANAFEDVFRREHGSGKEAATGLDAMKIITEIGNDINIIAPHISWLFEDSDCTIIQNIYNDSFFAPAEGQPV